MPINLLRRPVMGAALFVCAMHPAVAQEPLPFADEPVIKVDLNFAGRQEGEVNQPGFEPWPIPSARSVSQAFDGVTFTLSSSGDGGLGLRSSWYKTAIATAQLTGDGVLVDFGDGDPQGGAVSLTVNGLSEETHTLLLYLSSVDNWAESSVAPLNIYVNDRRVHTDVVMSSRVTDNSDAQTAYVTFSPDGGQVKVRIEADGGTGADIENVVLNGFELNTPNFAKQARAPVPADGDLHADADVGAGELRLEWTAAEGAVKQALYFGTDKTRVAEGDDSVFVREQTQTYADLTGLYSLDDYFWRVDQIEADGTVTRGNVWRFRPRQLAFPDAEGYGRFAIGGRGGKVVKVTNLNDSGPGSLRAAVEEEQGPRTIVFDVSGIITLESRLSINDSFVTVAGQTAPGKGIVIRSAPFGLSGANDVILQHIRVRLGAGETYDGIGMAGSDHSIVDHSSISWTIDEAFSSRNGKNITLQRTLIAEALNVAGHSNYPEGTAHGYAASISGDIGSFHHNLLAHNAGRNWSLAGGLDGDGNYAGRLDIFNNVVYNWDNRTTDGGAHEVNFVNNYYKPGPATSEMYALNIQYDNFPGTQRYYCLGNVIPGQADELNQRFACRVKNGQPDGYQPFVYEPFFPSHATIHTARQAYKNVLSDVGAIAPVQDHQDIRVINETLAGTTSSTGSQTGLPGLPDHQDDVGGYEDYPEVHRDASWDPDNDGMPTWWENQLGLDPQSAGDDANRDPDRDGYTQLEEYLHWVSGPLLMTTAGHSISVPLVELFRGYTEAPRYTVRHVGNGSVDIAGEAAVFTPTECGLGFFSLKVTDASGDFMTRNVRVFADADGCEREPDYSDVMVEQPRVVPLEPDESDEPDAQGGNDGNDTPVGGGSSGGGGAPSLLWLSLLLVMAFRGMLGARLAQ
ncbi:pectate lyase family protein [Marinimicrobium agarilyticum]|uniref:pectate lyase family protein n=1 Tax=Marinimicrobium agarilyticum TaxID=306546 RepID=UPI000417E1AD|nr:hypothetical protein [Marinimicrobium agarilyticum]